MVNWFIEKENKIPLYLQLKDLIKYYISTGVIKDHQKLPGVNELASELDINFDTVRKAYKELEKEGLVSMKRGTGSFVNLRDAALKNISAEPHREMQPLDSVRHSIRNMLRQGMAMSEIERMIQQAIADVSQDVKRQFLIFTECNLLQVGEISTLLEEQLKLKVRPALISELDAVLESLTESEGELLAIVTTGFHVNEVQGLLGDRSIEVLMLVTNMSPETRRSLEEYRGKGQLGFICRDQKSVPFYTDLLRSELGQDIMMSSSVMSDSSRVQEIVDNSDVLLVTPPVFEAVSKQVGQRKPVFNVFDRVDPISLMMLKDSMFRKNHR